MPAECPDPNRCTRQAATIASLEAEARDNAAAMQDNAATMRDQHAEITRLRAELEALRSVAGDVERAAIRAECDAFAVSRGRPCSYPDCACSTNLRSQYEVPARAVLAAVVPAIRAEGWQSIETAPRDADVLLGWWQNWPAHWQLLPEPPTAAIRAGGNDGR